MDNEFYRFPASINHHRQTVFQVEARFSVLPDGKTSQSLYELWHNYGYVPGC
jgi:hypothetical protein